jgi:ArsR family transcriptional regulator, arsenate/arsenite/antimonite-responsive transcriptional repressor
MCLYICYHGGMNTNEDTILALKALADPVRLSILEFLWDPVSDAFRTAEGICAGDIVDFLGVSQPTVSHHMKILVGAGLVEAEKRGQRVFYECITEGMDGVIHYLERYRQSTTPSLLDR